MALLLALLSSSLGGPLAAPVRALDAGKPLPEIGLPDLKGRSVSVAKLKGKVVVVDFWASWCAPCKEELPVLDRLYKKYRDKGLVVIGVNIDKDASNMRDFLKKHPVSFPVVHDGDHQVVKRYEPPKMPSSYIANKSGVVAKVQAGFQADDAAEIEKAIRSLL